MSVLVEDVLALWREAERLLDALPTDAEERDLVREEIERLHGLYRKMTERADSIQPTLTASAAAIERSRVVIERAQMRLSRSAGPSAAD